MAEFLNRVTLIGRLSHEPSIRTTASGKPLASLSVITSETWPGKDREREERTTWHKVVVFAEPLVNYASSRLRKGCWVWVEGKLQITEWEDKEGIKRQTTQIALDAYSGGLRLIEATPVISAPPGHTGRKRRPKERPFAPGEMRIPQPLIEPSDTNEQLQF